MRVIITDLLTGQCELTGRSDVEVVSVELDEGTPVVQITPRELVKLLRLRKRQEAPCSGHSTNVRDAGR